MTIPIKQIRPAVISEELAAGLDEYLSFRHVFSNIYGFELKGDRIDYLASKPLTGSVFIPILRIAL